MNPLSESWRLNLPQLFTLPDFSLDDAEADISGNVFVSDSINARVYKFAPNSVPISTFDVDYPTYAVQEGHVMNLAVDGNSNFFISDGMNGLVLKYDPSGKQISQYWTPGVLTICCSVQGALYVLSNAGGMERIDCYDPEGNLKDVFPAPKRNKEQSDPSLLNIDSDAHGNVFMSEGMPPYRIWRIRADGSGIDVCRRHVIDFPEDAILIADIGINRKTGMIYSLLACKEGGLQVIDCFAPTGEYVGQLGVPHNDRLFSVLCISPDTGYYILDTGTGPGAGDLMKASEV